MSMIGRLCSPSGSIAISDPLIPATFTASPGWGAANRIAFYPALRGLRGAALSSLSALSPLLPPAETVAQMLRSRRAPLTADSLNDFDNSSRGRRRGPISDVSTDTDQYLSDSAPNSESGSESDGSSYSSQRSHSAIPSRAGNFELVDEVRLHEREYGSDLTIAKWRSKETGLTVVWANTPGPIVKSWTTVVTEIFDDTGRPHTLEHLVFMGSEKYPFKGVLDTLANRCLSSGSNAETGVDSTTFTISTVGEQAMLQILPVYLDHIFNPTMTEEAFVTEVFNINGDGHESGVVFSEMQARADSSEDILELRMQQILYDSRNGYRSETGGRPDALRHLKNDDIKQYHDSTYVPQNVTIVICGESVDPARLLSVLDNTVEVDLQRRGLARGPHGPPSWRRPFLDTSSAQNPPQLPKNEKEVVFYPEEDDSVGEVRLHWIGPPARDFLTNGALAVLGDYLSGNSVSPLNLRFVEGKDPSASDISFTSDVRGVSVLHCLISSVPQKKLRTVGDEILQALKELVSAPVDLKRMTDVLHQSRRNTLAVVQDASAVWVQQNVLADILYGPDDGTGLEKVFGDLEIINQLGHWSARQWTDLLHEYFVGRPSLILIGKPSRSLSEKREAEKVAQAAATRERLGPAGLAAHGQRLRLAEARNAEPVPTALIESFRIPSLRHLSWIKTEPARAKDISQQLGKRFRGEVQDHVSTDVAVPLVLHFEHYPSHFIDFTIYLQSPKTHRLLPLFLASFFELPITRQDGRTISQEDVVKGLDRNFVWRSIRPAAEGIIISGRIEAEKYSAAIAWLSDLLTGAVFEVKKLVNIVVRSLQELPSSKEDGSLIASAGHQLLFQSENSVLWPCNIFNLVKTLPEVLQLLRSNPSAVAQEMRELRHDLTDPRAMRIVVEGDILALRKPTEPWTSFAHLSPFDISELEPVKRERDLMSSLGRRPSRKMVIYRLPAASGSTYSRHQSAGLGREHQDYPALVLANSALNAIEGYLWKAVRGPGLAYGANLAISPETRSLTFVLYRSPDAHAAFLAARQLIGKIASGEVSITQEAVDAAKSNLAFEVVDGLQTPSAVADVAALNDLLYDMPRDADRRLLASVQDVSVSEVIRAVRKYVLPVFDPSTSIAVISAGGDQLDGLASSFGSLGFQVQTKTV